MRRDAGTRRKTALTHLIPLERPLEICALDPLASIPSLELYELRPSRANIKSPPTIRAFLTK